MIRKVDEGSWDAGRDPHVDLSGDYPGVHRRITRFTLH